MKSQIYYVIPSEEEKYKSIFANGRIWNNNLWQTTSKYIEILLHYRGLIAKQREENKKIQDKEKNSQQLILDIHEWFQGECKFLIDPNNTDKRPYNRSELLPYLRENEYEKIKGFYNTYKLWQGEGSETLAELYGYLEDWEELQPWITLTTNPYEITLIKQTAKEITFNWQPPEIIFAHFDKFLFNYQGLWYEFSGEYERKAWNRAEIKANYSIYWNDYWYLLKANANGILYNSSYLQTEVCACPDFTQSEETVKNTFVVTNYELKWDLLQAWPGREKGNWYALWLNSKTNTKQSENPDFPWIKLGTWGKVNWDSAWDLMKLKDRIGDGKSEQLFSLVSQNLKDANSTSVNHFASLEAWTDVSVKKESGRMIMEKGEKAKEFIDWINTEYPEDLYHCQANHIETSILWRDKTIWKGNLDEIENGKRDAAFLRKKRLYLKLSETSNSSGTVVSFHDKYGNLIAQVHESIFIKIGKESQSNVILNTIISTAAGAVIGAVTGGVGAAVAGKAVGVAMGAAAAKGAAAAGIGAAVGGTKEKLLNYGESVRQEFTIDEFQHKFYRTGHYPISLILEQDNELINRYHANRTLKGIEGNQFFNTTTLGSYLKKEHFFKARFLTLNMFGLNKEWFKQKLEEGVRLGEGTFAKWEEDWYRLGLPRKRIASTGASATGDIDELIITDILHGGSGWDNLSHLGGGCWVYKDSYLRNDRGQDLLKDWLMPLYKGKMTREESDKWIFRHKDDFGPDLLEIPSHYFDPNKDYCRIDYKLHFYSSNEPAIIGQELHAKKIEITSVSSGNQQKITINVHGELKYTRKVSGEPPEGFNNPPPYGSPSGINNLPDNLEPTTEPDPNTPEPTPEETDPTAGIDPTLTPEPEPVPDEPELPASDPEPLPDEPEPTPDEPEPTPTPEPVPEANEPEV